MKLAESTENYLENILILSKRLPEVHSIDIANSMGFSKPSVSRAVHLLEEHDYIKISDQSHITLTEKGEREARRVYERHVFLREFLIEIGVDPETASVDACRMEHVVSPDTVLRLQEKYPEVTRMVKESAYDDEFILAFIRENG